MLAPPSMLMRGDPTLSTKRKQVQRGFLADPASSASGWLLTRDGSLLGARATPGKHALGTRIALNFCSQRRVIGSLLNQVATTKGRRPGQIRTPRRHCPMTIGPTGASTLRRMRSGPWYRLILIGACLAGSLAGSGCGPDAKEGPGRRAQTLALTPEQELSLGEQAYKEVLSKSRVIRDGPEVERIRQIGGRIVQAVDIEPLQREINLRIKGYRFDWEFNVLQNDQVNAFCLPGGKVAVFTGLLRVAEEDAWLATVMSHEIAHALAHHASERLAREQKIERAAQVASGVLGEMDPQERKEFIGILAAGAHFGSLPFDRTQETEADHIGLFL